MNTIQRGVSAVLLIMLASCGGNAGNGSSNPETTSSIADQPTPALAVDSDARWTPHAERKSMSLVQAPKTTTTTTTSWSYDSDQNWSPGTIESSATDSHAGNQDAPPSSTANDVIPPDSDAAWLNVHS